MAGQFTGSSKRVEAHPKSSNLVVNSVSLSRDLPVFPGFFEIIRVVHIKQKKPLYKANGVNLRKFRLAPFFCFVQGDVFLFFIHKLSM